ncbi:MAG TPA: pyridoxamine 5'-phosphate oxidase family protein [Gemmatimonadales bacterium]|nr:pyridoxamine 5'-phosphate oxidase family protein [Gemmatimonadales bacterium]
MAAQFTPTFRELARAEADAILARNHVGRMAFVHERVDIEPIHYVYANGVITCRTAWGTKLEALRHQHAVAFEVDEVEGPFDWRSVVVHGLAYIAEPTGSEHEERVYQESLAALRTLMPGALEPGDPAPFRTVILRIHIDAVHGRAASTSAGPAAGPAADA